MKHEVLQLPINGVTHSTTLKCFRVSRSYMTSVAHRDPPRSPYQDILEEKSVKTYHVVDVLPAFSRIKAIAQTSIEKEDFLKGTSGRTTINVIISKAHVIISKAHMTLKYMRHKRNRVGHIYLVAFDHICIMNYGYYYSL